MMMPLLMSRKRASGSRAAQPWPPPEGESAKAVAAPRLARRSVPQKPKPSPVAAQESGRSAGGQVDRLGQGQLGDGAGLAIGDAVVGAGEQQQDDGRDAGQRRQPAELHQQPVAAAPPAAPVRAGTRGAGRGVA